MWIGQPHPLATMVANLQQGLRPQWRRDEAKDSNHEGNGKPARWIHQEATKQHGSHQEGEGEGVGQTDERWAAVLGLLKRWDTAEGSCRL